MEKSNRSPRSTSPFTPVEPHVPLVPARPDPAEGKAAGAPVAGGRYTESVGRFEETEECGADSCDSSAGSATNGAADKTKGPGISGMTYALLWDALAVQLPGDAVTLDSAARRRASAQAFRFLNVAPKFESLCTDVGKKGDSALQHFARSDAAKLIGLLLGILGLLWLVSMLIP